MDIAAGGLALAALLNRRNRSRASSKPMFANTLL
jgi:hypothetical protein